MESKKNDIIAVIANAIEHDISNIAVLYAYDHKERPTIEIEPRENFNNLTKLIINEFDDDCIGDGRKITSIVAFDSCITFEDLLIALAANKSILDGDDINQNYSVRENN